ncbi:bacteriocin fulvocin C-related protein [Umezawaea sp.]|uniref:bacteriocin fulvocin C-related protein n=1 Tax=Umezawaea sp. TaxID=1955258 RepID=UPI002ED27AA2
MERAGARWILAFDASCRTCREVSASVDRAAGGKLEIMPLSHPDVRRWRARGTGSAATDRPALLRVDGDAARTWTGLGLGLALCLRLGPRSTARVLGALGEARRGTAPQEPPTGRLLSRAQLLRLAAGAVVAVGVLGKGGAPAVAEESAADEARAWVEANRGTLPQAYDDVAAMPMAYRREVYRASSPTVRARLWRDQFDRYRAVFGDRLTEARAGALDRAAEIASRDELFARERGLRRGEVPELDGLREAVTDAFGADTAYALVGVLALPGHERDAAGPYPPRCECASEDPWCDGRPCVYGLCCPQRCVYYGEACGTLWAYDCDGMCG